MTDDETEKSNTSQESTKHDSILIEIYETKEDTSLDTSKTKLIERVLELKILQEIPSMKRPQPLIGMN